MKTILTVLAALCLCSAAVCSDEQAGSRSQLGAKSAPAFPITVTLADPAAPSTIACRLRCNQILVPGRLNARDSCWFLLDTGSPYSLLNRDRLFPGQVSQSGSGEARTVSNVSIECGNLTLRADSLPARSLHDLEPVVGHRIDGLIGHDLFEQLVVTVDYVNGTVIMQAPGSLPYASDGSVVEVVVEEGESFVLAEVMHPDSSWRTAKMRLVTGGSDFASFNGAYVQSQQLVSEAQPRLAALDRAGSWVTRVAGFRAGGIEIAEPVVCYTPEGGSRNCAGSLGGEWFRRFTVTFDYPHSRIILKPNEHFSHPLNYDMSGMSIVAEGADLHSLRVVSIAPGSSAEKAGVQIGDYVNKVEGSPATTFSLSDLRRRLTIPRKLSVLMQRGKSTKKALLDLRPRI